MAFVGNTEHSVPFMLKNSNLFEALPKVYQSSAFLDRMHCYIPGWEISKLRGEMFTNDYGFIVDYIAEVMKELRKEDHTTDFNKYFDLSSNLTTRDRDGIAKTFSGFIKILYPHGEYTKEQATELFDFALECRKRVKDQLIRMDDTYEKVEFSYKDLQTGKTTYIETLENEIYGYGISSNKDVVNIESENPANLPEEVDPTIKAREGQITIRDNQTGISFSGLFAAHLKGAKKITLTDSYIRMHYQFKRLMEFCLMLSKLKEEEEEIDLHVITWNDPEFLKQSEEAMYELMITVEEIGIQLSYEFKDIHDRSIVADNGWTIMLGRGLDIYEKEESRFNLGDIDQERRRCKNFIVTYLRKDRKSVV